MKIKIKIKNYIKSKSSNSINNKLIIYKMLNIINLFIKIIIKLLIKKYNYLINNFFIIIKFN